MRPIKFAAYDKHVKKMGKVTQIIVSDVQHTLVRYRYVDDFGKTIDEQSHIDENGHGVVVLLQYTGEIDIKNNPIIENHIVTFDLYGNGEKQRGVVVYNQAAFYVQTDFVPSADGTHLGRPLAYELGKLIKNEKDVEVIGNIYENPELLEGWKCTENM